jgi:hypothetical protein
MTGETDRCTTESMVCTPIGGLGGKPGGTRDLRAGLIRPFTGRSRCGINDVHARSMVCQGPWFPLLPALGLCFRTIELVKTSHPLPSNKIR